MIRGLEKLSEKLAKRLTADGIRFENRSVLSKEKAAMIIKAVFEEAIAETGAGERVFIPHLMSMRKVGDSGYIEFRVKKERGAN